MFCAKYLCSKFSAKYWALFSHKIFGHANNRYLRSTYCWLVARSLSSKVHIFPAIYISRNALVVAIRNFQIMVVNVVSRKLDPNYLQNKLLLYIFKFCCPRNFTPSPFSMPSQSILFAFQLFDTTRTHLPVFCRWLQTSPVEFWSTFWDFSKQRVCHRLSCPCTPSLDFSFLTLYLLQCCCVTNGCVEVHGRWES